MSLNGNGVNAASAGLGQPSRPADGSVLGRPDAPPASASAGATQGAVDGSTSYIATPIEAPSLSPVVARLLEAGAREFYTPTLVKVPLPQVASAPSAPKKHPGVLSAARSLDGGASPLSPVALSAARSSFLALGVIPDASGESHVVGSAQASVDSLPKSNNLVMFARENDAKGGIAYLTPDRLQHVRENHTGPPQERGKRTTTLFPSGMSTDDIIEATAHAIQNGTKSLAVRDTRAYTGAMPEEFTRRTGVAEMFVSTAPDGLILSSYPTAGPGVVATRELTAAEAEELRSALARQQQQATTEADQPLFNTNVANTTFG